MTKPNDYELNMQLLMNAMNTAGQCGATYTLPEPVMLEYARLLRADERDRVLKEIRRESSGLTLVKA